MKITDTNVPFQITGGNGKQIVKPYRYYSVYYILIYNYTYIEEVHTPLKIEN